MKGKTPNKTKLEPGRCFIAMQNVICKLAASTAFLYHLKMQILRRQPDLLNPIVMVLFSLSLNRAKVRGHEVIHGAMNPKEQ